MDKTETLYDRIIRKLKNNKVVALVLIGFVVILGLAQLEGALSGIWTALFPAKTQMHIDAFVQKYDFLADVEEPPKPLESVQGDITQVKQAAEKLAGQLTTAIGVTSSKSEAVLRIDGSSLHATQPLRVAVIVFASPTSQAARVARNLGDAIDFDLRPLFADPHFTGPGGRSIEMEVRPEKGSFEREPLRIFKEPDGFSFAANVRVVEKPVTFSPHKVQMILVPFKAEGEDLKQATFALDSALRRALQDNPSLGLSGSTLEKLEAEKKTIRSLPPGPAKTQLSNQANVDYVITGKLW